MFNGFNRNSYPCDPAITQLVIQVYVSLITDSFPPSSRVEWHYEPIESACAAQGVKESEQGKDAPKATFHAPAGLEAKATFHAPAGLEAETTKPDGSQEAGEAKTTPEDSQEAAEVKPARGDA